jgi:hypothetical protein
VRNGTAGGGYVTDFDHFLRGHRTRHQSENSNRSCFEFHLHKHSEKNDRFELSKQYVNANFAPAHPEIHRLRAIFSNRAGLRRKESQNHDLSGGF